MYKEVIERIILSTLGILFLYIGFVCFYSPIYFPIGVFAGFVGLILLIEGIRK